MDKQAIKALFDKAGASIVQDDVWSVQGTPVVKHKALERLAAALSIRFDTPTILRAERDEAVILVTGTCVVPGSNGIGAMPTATEWSIGEACVNVNYLVKGKMAAYVYAMAEKRAKDRVILKLAGLHGVYSEEEADEFKGRAEAQADASLASRKYMEMALPIVERTRTASDLKEWWDAEESVRNDLLDDIQKARLKQAVTDKVISLKAKVSEHATV